MTARAAKTGPPAGGVPGVTSPGHRSVQRIRVAASGSGVPRREVQVNRLSVTFSAIGQPQRITAPAHAMPVYGEG